MRDRFTLFGWHLSYYTGKIRCYLAYKRIPFDDRQVGLWTLTQRIKRRVGAVVMPVVVTPQGEWLQDSSAIIDTLEARCPDRPVLPADPLQRFIAILLETWADEWWIPIAMHTRWSYPENLALFRRDAGAALLPWAPGFIQRWIANIPIKAMRKFLPAVGVTQAQIPALEAWTEAMLDQLDVHFAQHPYLLGAVPTMADFGLIGPMYGHLGRDPWPARELIAPRPHLRAWIDRMASPPADITGPTEIPPSLLPILRIICAEFPPMAAAINQALRAVMGDKQPGALIARGLGMVRFPMGAGVFERAGMSFTLWKMQRLLAVFAAMSTDDQAKTRAYITELGGGALLDLTIPPLRRVALQVALLPQIAQEMAA